jgi:hypothetical protein
LPDSFDDSRYLQYLEKGLSKHGHVSIFTMTR